MRKILINGYNTFSEDRVHSRRGGVCAFVSAGIPGKCKQDPEGPNFEFMWVWLRLVRLLRQISGLICAILQPVGYSSTKIEKPR